MKIRSLARKDRARLLSLLIETKAFTAQEIDVAMELIDIVLKNKDQKDYRIECAVNEKDEVFGYTCYGPAPMTQGTFDLYWIAVSPANHDRGIGSALLGVLEEEVKANKGRMILVDTSSTAQYGKAHRFYLQNGFREIARVPDYYSQGNDRITFCKKLG